MDGPKCLALFPVAHPSTEPKRGNYSPGAGFTFAFSFSSRVRGSRSSPIRSRPTLNSPPSPLALSNCSSTLVLCICVFCASFASHWFYRGIPVTSTGTPKLRAEISSSAGSFQLSTLNLRPLVPNFSSRFPPACAVSLLPCAVHPPFLLSPHIPQSIQTFGLTNFT